MKSKDLPESLSRVNSALKKLRRRACVTSFMMGKDNKWKEREKANAVALAAGAKAARSLLLSPKSLKTQQTAGVNAGKASSYLRHQVNFLNFEIELGGMKES